VKGLGGMTYKEGLRMQDLFSLEKRKLRSDLIAVCSFLMRASREGGADPWDAWEWLKAVSGEVHIEH